MNAKYDIDIESTETSEETPVDSSETPTMDISEHLDSDFEFPAEHDDGSWNDTVDISTGDSGQASVTVSGGDINNADISSGDAGTGGNLSDYRVAYMEVPATDYTDALLSVQESLDSLNSTLLLVLLFLLLSWTEKKISTAVHKFTRERRR